MRRGGGVLGPALALAWLIAAVPAAAQQPATPAPVTPNPVPAAVIVVVDFQLVLRDSVAARGVQAEIERRRTTYQAEFAALERELRALETQLSEQRGTLTAEAFAQRRRDFEQRVAEAQRRAQERRAALDQAFEGAMNEIREMLLAVIADLAGRAGANIVLNKSQVILSDRGLDLTEQALAELDQRLPAVTVAAVEGETP